jgi:GNAT superfamily N-acetyltransferase
VPTVERILPHLRRTVESIADEVVPVDLGWVARTRTLPLVWTLNQICLTAAATPGEVASLAETHQGDLPFRHVVLEDAVSASETAACLETEGWEVDRAVFMVLSAPRDREVDTRAVVGLSEAQMTDLMRQWLIDERPGATAEELDEVTTYMRREGRLWDEQCLGVLGADGEPAAITKLRSDGPTAWVEDVYTVPGARGHGHARALVSRAVDLATSTGHELVFILADDNDWPKDLYAKIGFRPVGTTMTLHRDLPAGP